MEFVNIFICVHVVSSDHINYKYLIQIYAFLPLNNDENRLHVKCTSLESYML